MTSSDLWVSDKPHCFIDIQANLPNFSLWTSWQVPFSLWLGSTPGSQTCQVIYWIRESYCWLSPCVTQQPAWCITHFQHCPSSALRPSWALNWWCRAGDSAGCCGWCNDTWQDMVLWRALLNGLPFPAAAEIKPLSLHTPSRLSCPKEESGMDNRKDQTLWGHQCTYCFSPVPELWTATVTTAEWAPNRLTKDPPF